ncbi:MAG: amino acid ABC transporter substrate-binding protein [Alphaproteobacteria bacterium]
MLRLAKTKICLNRVIAKSTTLLAHAVLRLVGIAAFTVLVLTASDPLRAAPRTSIRIGYVISQSGPNEPGASLTSLANYKLWVKTVNDAGGIMLSSINKRLPIEVIEYDDHSDLVDAVKGVEKLIKDDKVDFILPPWGTRLNLAVAPILDRAGYPLLASTAMIDNPTELAKRWSNVFWCTGSTVEAARSLVAILAKLRADGKIGNSVAMIYVADELGIELSKSSRDVIRAANFDLVYDRAYPFGTTALTPILQEVKQRNPDVFIAFSYPPDTFALTERARAIHFNPKIYYTGVGTAFPDFRDRFTQDAQGVLGLGGWNADLPAAREYLRRHTAIIGQEPDRWASPVTYATLQVLQQAIERAGRIDRAAVIAEIKKGTFDTVAGPMTFKDNFFAGIWYVGQWQNGEFYGVAPDTLPGARKVIAPKPPWGATN